VAVYSWYMRQEYWNKKVYSFANWTCVIQIYKNRKSKYFFSLQVPCWSKHLPQFYSWWQCTTVNLWSFPLYWILWSNFPVQCQVLSGTVRTGKYSCKSDRPNLYCCVPTAVTIHDHSPTCPASIPIASHVEPLNLTSCIFRWGCSSSGTWCCVTGWVIVEVLKVLNAAKCQEPLIRWQSITSQKKQILNYTATKTTNLTQRHSLDHDLVH